MNGIIARTMTAGALLLVLGATEPARAQNVSLGFDLGLSMATFSGDANGERLDLRHEPGVHAGATVTWAVRDLVSLETGLSWIRKGATGTVLGFEEALATDIRLDYLQAPLLARLHLPLGMALRPALFAGPAVAFETDCGVRTAPSELALTLGCGGEDHLREKIDWSVLVGGGLAYDVGGTSLHVDGRYDVGLVKIAAHTDNLDVRNRAFVLTTGVSFPLGR